MMDDYASWTQRHSQHKKCVWKQFSSAWKGARFKISQRWFWRICWIRNGLTNLCMPKNGLFVVLLRTHVKYKLKLLRWHNSIAITQIHLELVNRETFSNISRPDKKKPQAIFQFNTAIQSQTSVNLHEKSFLFLLMCVSYLRCVCLFVFPLCVFLPLTIHSNKSPITTEWEKRIRECVKLERKRKCKSFEDIIYVNR